MSRKVRPVHKTVVRYVHPVTGERLSKSTPGAKRVVQKTEAYYARLTVGGKRQTIPLGTSDESAAWQTLRELLRRQAEGAAGIRDEYTDHAARPLADHVEAWAESLRDRGVGAAHVERLRSSVIQTADLAGWKRIADLSARGLTAALAQLADRGSGPQTCNHHLAYAQQFSRWLWDDRRLREHPLRGVRPAHVEGDLRHARRSPSGEEVGQLFDYLYGPDVRRRGSCRSWGRDGMTGPQRALGYKVAMATGLRARELRSLSRESFDLDAGTVTLKAAYDKRRRPATQHLPAWLVDELREWFAADGGCWGMFPAHHPGVILKYDLRDAGVAYQTNGPDGPLFFDFHSLRHWYCTQVANQPGISPKTMMTLCRHSNPRLTMKVYAKAKLDQVKAAVAQIPRPGK